MYDSNIYLHPTACRIDFTIDGFLPCIKDDGTVILVDTDDIIDVTQYDSKGYRNI